MSDHREGSVDPRRELADALDDAYRALRDACHHARRVLMDSRPGRLPFSWECRPEDRWLLDAIEVAERDVDRLRLRAQPCAPAAAARRAAAAALPATLGQVGRRQREAERMLGVRAG